MTLHLYIYQSAIKLYSPQGILLLHERTEVATVGNTPFSAVTLSALYGAACDDALAALKEHTKGSGFE